MTKLEALRLRHKIDRTLLWIDQMLEIYELERPDEMIKPDEAAIIAKFDAATTKIADRINKLIAAGGISAEAEAELTRIASTLEALGSDPENPIPPPA